MTVPSLSLPSRFWLAWVCAFRVLFDAHFAGRVAALQSGAPEPDSDSPALPSAVTAAPSPAPALVEAPLPANGALQLLALLQREGRLLDFIQQDVAAFPDADIGAAARVVHEGCRRALHAHAQVRSVLTEAEGAPFTLESAREDVKLVGNVRGSAPFRGVLRHRGWRIDDLKLPTLVGAHDQAVIAPAELELT